MSDKHMEAAAKAIEAQIRSYMKYTKSELQRKTKGELIALLCPPTPPVNPEFLFLEENGEMPLSQRGETAEQAFNIAVDNGAFENFEDYYGNGYYDDIHIYVDTGFRVKHEERPQWTIIPPVK